MARIPLNILAVRSLKPAAKRYDIGVAGYKGLWLRINPSGHKSFMLRFGQSGKKMMLDSPATDLAAVAAECAELRRQFRAGIDPRDARERQQAAARQQQQAQDSRLTVQGLAERYLDGHARFKRSGKEDARMVRVMVLPALGDQYADAVQRREVRELVEDVAQRAPAAANRLLGMLHKMFNYGIEKDLVQLNPCAGLKKPGRETPRERVLDTAEELRQFWSLTDPDAGKMPVHACLALRFLLLSGSRSGEVCGMTWTELTPEADAWLLPAARSKNAKAHLVPLTDTMREIIASRPITERPIFWTPAARLDSHQLAKLLREAMVKHWTGQPFRTHDLRRSAETGMAAAGVLREIRDQVLNHAVAGMGAKVYDKFDYMPQKRAALETWDRRLHSLLTGASASVTEIRRA
ncbi:MAG: tyrosine-type recombinase/integrase [Proteobacteria bacterium]|nr:tyrosine-type recombinase/integrase [Pseudomonadota bacterium]